MAASSQRRYRTTSRHPYDIKLRSSDEDPLGRSPGQNGGAHAGKAGLPGSSERAAPPGSTSEAMGGRHQGRHLQHRAEKCTTLDGRRSGQEAMETARGSGQGSTRSGASGVSE